MPCPFPVSPDSRARVAALDALDALLRGIDPPALRALAAAHRRGRFLWLMALVRRTARDHRRRGRTVAEARALAVADARAAGPGATPLDALGKIAAAARAADDPRAAARAGVERAVRGADPFVVGLAAWLIADAMGVDDVA